MKNNKLLWKLMVLVSSVLLVSACLTDDDDDGDNGGFTAEQKAFLEDFLQHNWQSDCTPNENSSYTEYTMFFDGGTQESNIIQRSGWDYSDDTCQTLIHTHEGVELVFKLGEAFDEGEGGASGYEIDLSVKDGDQKAYQIISKVYDDGGGEYFYMGVDLDESQTPVVELDLSSPENRPTEFDTTYVWHKQ